MAIGTAAALLATVASSAIGAGASSSAAGRAANAQASAATQAAQIQADAANRATDLQASVYQDQRNLSSPSVRLGAGALARQARMAGLTPAEIAQFYNGQVNALNAPMPGSGGTLSDAELQQRYPDLYAQWQGLGHDGINGNAAANPTFSGYVRNTQGADALTRAPQQATGDPGADYAAQDLGNLDEFAPQQFSFTAQDLYADPSYQFRLDQGQKALERSAAARGRLFSGATGQALVDYGQQSASQEFDTAYNRAFNAFQIEDTNKWNRLGALSGAGSNATAQLMSSGSAYASGAGQTIQNAGNAAAQGVLNAGNARASGYQAQGEGWGGFFNNTIPGAIGFAQGQGWFGKG